MIGDEQNRTDHQVGAAAADSPRRLYVAESIVVDDRLLLAACIAATGDETYWLLRTDILGQDGLAHGRPDVAHERLGPLPAAFRRRLRPTSARCGATRRTGQPCEATVQHVGDRCRHHGGTPDAETTVVGSDRLTRPPGRE